MAIQLTQEFIVTVVFSLWQSNSRLIIPLVCQVNTWRVLLPHRSPNNTTEDKLLFKCIKTKYTYKNQAWICISSVDRKCIQKPKNYVSIWIPLIHSQNWWQRALHLLFRKAAFTDIFTRVRCGIWALVFGSGVVPTIQELLESKWTCRLHPEFWRAATYFGAFSTYAK